MVLSNEEKAESVSCKNKLSPSLEKSFFMSKLRTNNFLCDFHLRNFFIFSEWNEKIFFSRCCNKTHSMPTKDGEKKWLRFVLKKRAFLAVPKTIFATFFRLS